MVNIHTYVSIKKTYVLLIWKKSFIISLYKNGTGGEVCNWKGIAKVNDIPKLFQKHPTESLYHQISSFSKARSTRTKLLESITIVLQQK